jgi:tRNA A37 methylthiotransferase MiaB
VGKNVPVLVEEISSGVAEGLTPHFLRVKLRSEALVVKNEVARVFIEGTKDGDLFGRIVKNK